MPVCKKCGCFTSDPNVCLNCGAPRGQSAPVKKRAEETGAEKTPAPRVNWNAEPVEKKPEAPAVKKAEAPRVKKAEAPRVKKAEAPKPKSEPAKDDDMFEPVGEPVRYSGEPSRFSDDEPPKKKRKGLVITLIIILCLAIAAAGVAVYFLFFKGSSTPDSFDYNCAKLTDELNRVLQADGSNLKLSLNKWKYNQVETAFEYNGSDFTLRAETLEKDITSKIKKLNAGPAASEQGLNMAGMCVIALDSTADRNSVLSDINSVKQGAKDQASYSGVTFTYDKQKDEFVLVPGKGVKSSGNAPAAQADNASAASGTPATANSGAQFACGKNLVKAGGTYVFSDGSRIFYRKSITDNNSPVLQANNDGQLLSDGQTVFYVIDNKNERKLCSVSIDGTNQQTLLTVPDNIYLIHVYNNALYYVSEGLGKAEDYHFKKLDLGSKETSDIADVAFDPRNVIVSGDKMYCSMGAHGDKDINNISAYSYSFATGEYVEAVKNCIVVNYGFFNGAGSPCLESYKVKDDGSLSDHFLYTEENGKLVKSPEITVNAKLEVSSPKTLNALLCGSDNSGKKNKCYLFDKQTGKCSQVAELKDSKLYMGALFDISDPSTLAVVYEPKGSDEKTEGKMFTVQGAELTEVIPEDFTISYGSYFVAEGYLIDGDFDAHKIISEDDQSSDDEEADAEGDDEQTAEDGGSDEAGNDEGEGQADNAADEGEAAEDNNAE